MTAVRKPTDVIVLDEETCLVRVGVDHVAVVDRADAALVSSFRWCPLVSSSGRVYAQSYMQSGAIVQKMHRLLAETPARYQTDHINGDGLDNRRANLRPATGSQNNANKSKLAANGGKPSTSGYKGVSRSRDRWLATITVGRKSRYLGRYRQEEDAARAYDAAAHSAWGDFARLNFPRKAT